MNRRPKLILRVIKIACWCLYGTETLWKNCENNTACQQMSCVTWFWHKLCLSTSSVIFTLTQLACKRAMFFCRKLTQSQTQSEANRSHSVSVHVNVPLELAYVSHWKNSCTIVHRKSGVMGENSAHSFCFFSNFKFFIEFQKFQKQNVFQDSLSNFDFWKPFISSFHCPTYFLIFCL